MASTNVTQLRIRLKELLLKLEKFDVELEEDFIRLDISWADLDQAWDGYAYQEFQQSWNEVRSMIKQYNSMSVKYENFLRERIVALVNFERTGGI